MQKSSEIYRTSYFSITANGCVYGVVASRRVAMHYIFYCTAFIKYCALLTVLYCLRINTIILHLLLL